MLTCADVCCRMLTYAEGVVDITEEMLWEELKLVARERDALAAGVLCIY